MGRCPECTLETVVFCFVIVDIFITTMHEKMEDSSEGELRSIS